MNDKSVREQEVLMNKMDVATREKYEAWKRRRILKFIVKLGMLIGVILASLILGLGSCKRNDEVEKTSNNVLTDLAEPTDSINEAQRNNDQVRDRGSLAFCGVSDPEHATVLTDEQALSYLTLVNNCYRVARNFTPGDLSAVHVESRHVSSGTHHLLRESAARAAEALFQAAQADGIFLIATSGYRSYELQTLLHSNAVRDFGLEEARRRSAVPGHSEHQLGLALDLSTHALDGSLIQTFTETPEGIWVNQNAYLFGFIISFPYGREADTGIMYEPWHIRYVGVEAATEIVNQDQILEEYLWYNDE